ncbi:MAG: MMPL family transporter [Bacteroidales bacterium]|nr:MMPL family transporter [Bacteroidales bacterium]
MGRFFVSLYRFFRGRKALMYTLLILSSVVFVFLGVKVRYEEDIAKLLMSSNRKMDLVFGNLRVKDKLFVQIKGQEDTLDTYTLGALTDEFIEALVERDSTLRHIDNVLYRIEPDLPLMALDYALSNVPSFVSEDCYPVFDSLCTSAAVEATMQENADAVMNDWTGSATQMVATDPLGLRKALMSGISLGGSDFKVMDGHLFSADSTVALAFVAPTFSSFDSKEGAVLVGEIEALVSEFESAHPEVRVYFHGSAVRGVFNARTIKKDIFLTIGLSLLLILVVLCLCYKSVSLIWKLVLPAAYGSFFALATIYLIKGGMSLIALGIGAIVLGVAISYSLHVLTHFRHVGDVEKVLSDESTPVILGCITTIGAFLGLLFTESDLLKDFGIFSSLALAGNTIFALVFLPHFLGDDDRHKNDRVFGAVARVNDYPYSRKPLLVGASVIVIVAGCIFAGKVKFDADIRNLNYMEPKVLESEQLYASKVSHGLSNIYYAATADNLDDALDNSVGLAALLDSLKDAGVVTSTSSMVTKLFVSTDGQQKRIDRWNSYWTEDRIGEVRKTLSASARRCSLDPEMFAPFYAMVGGDYQPSSLYEAGIVPESLSSNFIEKKDDGTWLVFCSAKMPAENCMAAGDAVSAVPHCLVIDPFYYTTTMVTMIHDDFSVMLGISSLFVFAVLLLSFWNVWIALIAFMPMFFSWYVVQGIMAIFGIEFNLINIVISTFIFGIGVDYSIFVMQGLLSAARNGSDDLLRFHKTAIFFSAFVLIVVVSSLLFAIHPAIHGIGVSTLIGMVATISITYILQPLVFGLLLKVPYFRKSFKVNG